MYIIGNSVVTKSPMFAYFQKYFGSIEPIEDQNTMVYYSLRQRNQQEIRYSVHFPIQDPLPQLTKLTVNNKVICSQTLSMIILAKNLSTKNLLFLGNIDGAYTKFKLYHTLIRPTPPFIAQLFDSTNPPIPSPLVNIGKLFFILGRAQIFCARAQTQKIMGSLCAPDFFFKKLFTGSQFFSIFAKCFTVK
jgi:Serine protease gd N-terminus